MVYTPLQEEDQMASIKITRTAWIEHISMQAKCNLTQTAYCHEHGINISAFRYWKKRNIKSEHNTMHQIVEVPMRFAESNSGMLKLGFPNGCFLHIPAGWKAATIIELAKSVYLL
jgi:hypothetical protein